MNRTRHTIVRVGDSVEVDYSSDFERGAVWIPFYMLGCRKCSEHGVLFCEPVCNHPYDLCIWLTGLIETRCVDKHKTEFMVRDSVWGDTLGVGLEFMLRCFPVGASESVDELTLLTREFDTRGLWIHSH